MAAKVIPAPIRMLRAVWPGMTLCTSFTASDNDIRIEGIEGLEGIKGPCLSAVRSARACESGPRANAQSHAQNRQQWRLWPGHLERGCSG